MDKFFLFASLILSNLTVNGQQYTSRIIYKDGESKLNKLMIRSIAHADTLDKDNELRKLKRKINILFTIKKNGTIGDQIFIISVGDSILNDELNQFIKQTNGKWINNTGMDQWVILPILSSIADDRLRKLMPGLNMNYYNKSDRMRILQLKPLEINFTEIMR